MLQPQNRTRQYTSLIRGAIIGTLFAVFVIIIGNFLPKMNILGLPAEIVAAFGAGFWTAKKVGTVKSGSYAGLWTVLFSLLISSVITTVLIVFHLSTSKSPVAFSISGNLLSAPIGVILLLFAILAILLVLAIVLAIVLAVGVGAGALGGLIGKKTR